MRLRQVLLGGTLAALALLTGCAASPSVGPPPSASASATPDPAHACAQLIGYWVGQEVTPHGDWGLDYQEMGLSEGEYQILQSLLPAAHHLATTHGLPAVRPAATAWALPRCRAYLAGRPSPGAPGWPQ